MLSASLPVGLLLLCSTLVDGLRVPIHTRQNSDRKWSELLAGQDCSPDDDNCAEVSNVLDIAYATSITLGGKQFQVLLDTGSSDLWVDASMQTFPNVTILNNMTVSELYTDGSNYTGPVAIGDVDLRGFSVKNQYFTYATISHNNTVRDLGIDGILGLGFKSISEVFSTVKTSTGSDQLGLPFLYNLFRSDPSLNTTISLSLSQISHTRNASMGGSFLIGEIEQGFEEIESQTALELVPSDSVEWTFPVDSLQVDGQTLDLPAPTVSNSKTHVGLLDSGTSNILVPLAVVRAIYQQVEGAQTFLASPTREVWVLPCSAIPPFLTLIIGGQEIPIHPLDLNVVGGVYETSTGGLVTVCFGGVIATEPVAGVFDFVLGSPFLRNVYSLFDYGNKIRNVSNVSLPTVKFLAITEPEQAAAEFNRTRAAQLARAPPASGDQIAAILNGSPDFVPVNPINPSLGGGKIDAGTSSAMSQYQRPSLIFIIVLVTTFLFTL